MNTEQVLDGKTTAFKKWCYNETLETGQDTKALERSTDEKQALEEERRQLEKERRQFERLQKEFARRIEIEDRRLEQEKKLFDMKVKILEEELQKLATEKEHLEKQKAFYSRVNQYERESAHSYNDCFNAGSNIVKGDMFFSGVGSEKSLKKRYKDLIKIYHPDNLDGDKDTIQEINSQYHKLCAVYK